MPQDSGFQPLAANQWQCELSALPSRVHLNERMELALRLRNQRFDELRAHERESVYNGLHFTFGSTGGDGQLDSSIANALPNRVITGRGIQFDVPIPANMPIGDYNIPVTASAIDATVLLNLNLVFPTPVTGSTTINVNPIPVETESRVTLQRTFAGPTDDRALWPTIRNRTAAIGFARYKRFIDCIFCEGEPLQNLPEFRQTGQVWRVLECLNIDPQVTPPQLNIHGPYAYSVLKFATQVFLTLESGVVLRDDPDAIPRIFDIQKERIRVNDFSLTLRSIQQTLESYLQPDNRLPYLNRILANLITVDPDRIEETLPYCLGVLQHRLTSPSLIELIYSYWLEEGMLFQTMNAIARRFQNRRGSRNDPLGELEFDPLRPLNNLIWGFIQEEHNRLTVSRRAHEYHHHYGLSLIGNAVADLNPADIRSKFIEAFHNLLSCAARFYLADADTTMIADAFPLLNALREVHLILAEGAHNQFGDLTWTARVEMLTMQWMLARPEMKEFLRGRYMVPYQEEWMGAVDSMKRLQGWTDTTITHFFDLALTGERILLSIRYGDWSDIENIEDQAKNWARSSKPEVQRYIHAYRTATGVDLAADVVDTRDAALRYLQPAVLLQRRLAEQTATVQPRVVGRSPDLVVERVSGQAALPSPGRQRLPVYRKES